MKDISNFKTFKKIEPINKGWSSDTKYFVETFDNQKYLLRVSDISEHKAKKQEFENIKKFATLGFKMSLPVDFSMCDNGQKVYQLLTWCDGVEAKELLPTLSVEEQYNYGCKAGEILLKMQKLETYPPSADWGIFFGNKIKNYIEAYKNCGKSFKGYDEIINFINANSHYMNNRPRCFLHEDFQSDNMVISPNKELYIIDFQQCGIVDPYYALMSAMVTGEVSTTFTTGQIKTYFNNNIPEDFWILNASYMAAEGINVFNVACTLGKEELNYSYKMINYTLEWFNNMKNVVPNWYKPV